MLEEDEQETVQGQFEQSVELYSGEDRFDLGIGLPPHLDLSEPSYRLGAVLRANQRLRSENDRIMALCVEAWDSGDTSDLIEAILPPHLRQEKAQS